MVALAVATGTTWRLHVRPSAWLSLQNHEHRLGNQGTEELVILESNTVVSTGKEDS